MVWINPDLDLFHGTDAPAGRNIAAGGVLLSRCQALTDFGRGFYLTSNRTQAEQWANVRARQNSTAAVVLAYRIDRNLIAMIATLTFTQEGASADYWDFVQWCRTRRQLSHSAALTGRNPADVYDLVVGPVSLWQQRLIIRDADQWSFHTTAAPNVLPSRLRPADRFRTHTPPTGQYF